MSVFHLPKLGTEVEFLCGCAACAGSETNTPPAELTLLDTVSFGLDGVTQSWAVDLAIPLLASATDQPPLTPVEVPGGSEITTYGGTVPIYISDPQHLRALVWGEKWDNSLPITYYFKNNPLNPTAAWAEHEKTAYRAALQTWADVANLTFQEVFTESAANFVEQKYNAAAGAGELGLHYTPGPGITSVGGWYNYNGYGWSVDGLKPGGLGFSTLVHEIGHGLGLAHPHDNGGSSSTIYGVYGPFGYYGYGNQNQNIYTIMSYNHGYGLVQGGLGTNYNTGTAATPMPLDIAAIQHIYGANTSTNSGNNVYVLPEGATTAWKGIYDTGGIDEIRYDGGTKAYISLLGATLDATNLPTTQTVGGVPSYVDGVRGGFTIANNSQIENATGGFGADSITGNQIANTLLGRDGADTIYGGGGGDNIVGGAASDTLYGDEGLTPTTGITISGTGRLADPSTNLSQAAALDMTVGFSTAFNQYANFGYNVPWIEVFDYRAAATGSAWYKITVDAGTTIDVDIDSGNNQGQPLDTWVRLRSAAGAILADNDDRLGDSGSLPGSSLDAGVTHKVLSSGTYYIEVGMNSGGAFSAFLPGNTSYWMEVSVIAAEAEGKQGVAGNDTIDGGDGADTLTGGAGNDYLDGGTGNDSVAGGDGIDVIAFANSSSSIIYTLAATGSGTITTADLGTDTFTGIEGIAGGIAADNLSGTAGANMLIGNNGDDTLTAFDGSDTLDGGNGNDTLDGGIGVDFLYAGAGNDSLLAGTDGDVLHLGSGSDSADGGAGADAFYLADGVTGDYDSIDGGSERDLLDMSAFTKGVWFDMEYNPAGNNLFTPNGFGRVRNIESFIATAYDDILRGNSDSNLIVGGDGNDQILGYSPYDPIFGLASLGDVMEGGAGNDTMFSGTGNDWMDGGSGDDQIEVGGGNDRVITGLGNDTIYISPRSGDDTIVDFAGGTGAGDVLRLYNFGEAFDTFAEVYAAATQVGAHTHIILTDTRIILENFTRTNLAADDVLIV